MNNPAVVVRHISKRFRRDRGDQPRTLKAALLRGLARHKPEYFWGLKDVSLTVEHGKTIGIIGHNGSGKSTLLRLIGGLGLPDEGVIETRGRIGAILDLTAGLSLDLTGRENLFLLGVIAGMTRAQVEERFDEIVEFAELSEFIDNPVRTYSSGMQIRLAFAVAAHIEPDVLLVDEVLAVGDLPFQAKCLDRIRQFRSSGRAILIVSHDLDQLAGLCDEVVWLKGGRIAGFGPPKHTIDEYRASVHVTTRTMTPPGEHVTVLPTGERLELNVNRWGTQEIEIQRVQLRSSCGATATTVAVGHGLIVEIAYCAKGTATSGAIASFTLRSSDGVDCLDTNTEKDGLQLITNVAGVLRLHIDRLDLSAGEYLISVGLWEKDWTYAYDYHSQAYRLFIDGARADKGFLRPPVRWSLSETKGRSDAALDSRA